MPLLEVVDVSKVFPGVRGNVQSNYQQVISGAFLAIVVVAQTYLTKFRRVT